MRRLLVQATVVVAPRYLLRLPLVLVYVQLTCREANLAAPPEQSRRPFQIAAVCMDKVGGEEQNARKDRREVGGKKG